MKVDRVLVFLWELRGLIKAYFHLGLIHYPLMPEEIEVLDLVR